MHSLDARKPHANVESHRVPTTVRYQCDLEAALVTRYDRDGILGAREADLRILCELAADYLDRAFAHAGRSMVR
jgi:hypothetical protein